MLVCHASCWPEFEWLIKMDLIHNLSRCFLSNCSNVAGQVKRSSLFKSQKTRRLEQLEHRLMLTSDLQPIIDVNPEFYAHEPIELVSVQDHLFYSGKSRSSIRQLWKSDGTEAGTIQLTEFVSTVSSLSELTNSAGRLFFAANDGGRLGIELWMSDGTQAGTRMVKDINPNGRHSSPTELTDVSGTLFFTAFTDRTSNNSLWKSDGTDAGTIRITPATANISRPHSLIAGDGTLFFSAGSSEGYALWKSDGTDEGTTIVRAFTSDLDSRPEKLTYASGRVFFVNENEDSSVVLWRSDGTAEGTVPVLTAPRDHRIDQLTSVGANLFMAVGKHGDERLWASDGTVEGTALVKDVQAAELTDVDGVLFFRGREDASIHVLWKSDGTAEGTVVVKDKAPGSPISPTRFPAHLTNLSGTLYFSARGRLWKSDGSSAGTVEVRHVSSNELTAVGSTLFFVADDGNGGDGLWRTNGTEDGTLRVVAPTTHSSRPRDLEYVDGNLYFVAE